MKQIVFFLSLLSFTAFGQITKPVKKEEKPCYDKSARNGGKRYTEWECGKLAGVVDCNEKLELDPQSNTVMSASSHKPFSGTCETCHMNGILERRVKFVNGKTEGVDSTTYSSGCLMVIRSHVGGVEHGKWSYYYDSTNYKAWEMNYNLGQLHGDQIYFSKRGDTTKLETYVNGVLNGQKVSYWKGKRSKVVTYKNGLMNGPFLVYNEKDTIIEEINFRDGKKDGVFKYYYEDGKLLRTENWTMDVKNGEFKMFYYDGSVQKIETYRKGVREGLFEERFADKKVKRRSIYKKDVLIEEQVYDEQGRLVSSVGGQQKGGAEDDAVPTGDKKKKKPKGKKEETPPAPVTPAEGEE